MTADLTVVCKCHTDHKDQRQYSKRKNEKYRRRHKKSVQVLVKQGFQIFPEIVHMFLCLCQAFRLIGTPKGAPPCQKHKYSQKYGSYSVKENQYRLITSCIHINLLCLIPYLFLFHCTQRRQHA